MTEEKFIEFFCPNKNCVDYGKRNSRITEYIKVKDHYGKNRTTLLACKTCKKSFSETRGTIFFRLHTPKEKVLQVLATLAEKGSIRGTGRAAGADKDTVSAWLKKAGEHCEEVTEHLFRDLNLSQVQIDEIWTFVKKDKNLNPEDDCEKVKTKWVLIAQEAKTKLIISHQEGKRDFEDSVELIEDVEKRETRAQNFLFLRAMIGTLTKMH